MTVRKKPVAEVSVPAAVANRFVVKERLGARVFAAFDPTSQLPVALKVVREPTAAARLLQRVLGLPHLTQLRSEDLGTLVLELRAGGALPTYVARHAADFGEKAAAAVLRDVLTGLVGLHKVGLVHLDVSAAHVLLDDKNKAWSLEGKQFCFVLFFPYFFLNENKKVSRLLAMQRELARRQSMVELCIISHPRFEAQVCSFSFGLGI
jgi:serine/threonine protein kinase